MNQSNTSTTIKRRPLVPRFLFWLSGFLPCRIISDGDQPYLERYYLATVFGWQFYLHRFVASDPDRGLHDHPWRLAFSLILSGFYYEETRSGNRKVRWFNCLTGDSFHRVVLPYKMRDGDSFKADAWTGEQPCWSLFFHGPVVKRWGFMRELLNGQPLNAAWRGGLPARFEPYAYTREGDQKRWWAYAKKGRNTRGRAPE